MHEMTARRLDIDSHASVSPEPPVDGYGADNANDSYVIRSISNDRVSPFGRRGPSRRWLPGTWGDPF
jgi:hypothetical protein